MKIETFTHWLSVWVPRLYVLMWPALFVLALIAPPPFILVPTYPEDSAGWSIFTYILNALTFSYVGWILMGVAIMAVIGGVWVIWSVIQTVWKGSNND